MSDAEGLEVRSGWPRPETKGGRSPSQNCEQHCRGPPMSTYANGARHQRRTRRLGERLRELWRRAEPVGRCLGERPGDRTFQLFGNALPDGPDAGYRLHHALGDDRLGGWPGIRRLPGEHLVEHAPEGVDVGAAIHVGIAGCLLGAHVVRCAEREPGLRQPLRARGGEGSRDPEVSDDSLSAGEQDVLGLDVTVHHAAFVGIAQRCRHVASDAHGFVYRELLFAYQAVAKRLALRHRA